MAKDKKDEKVSIVYVGRKPMCTDNVAKSGKQWAGFGDVQEVTQPQAAILLRYPDQWIRFDPKNPPAREFSIEENLKRMNEVHEQLAKQPSGHGPGARKLEDMNEDELVDHARHYYGLDLDKRMSAEEMRMFIAEAVANAGMDAEKDRNADMLTGEEA